MLGEGSQIRPNDCINVTRSSKLLERPAPARGDSRQRAISGPSVTRPWILWRPCDARKLAPVGPKALRDKPIYRRPDKNTNDDGGARTASFGLRKRLEIVREGDEKVLEAGREEGGRGGRKWDGREKEREKEKGRERGRKREERRERGGGRELDRARRMRKEERNCRSNVASVRGVCLERRRLHQPSDRATRFSLLSFLLPPQDRTDSRRLSVWIWTA